MIVLWSWEEYSDEWAVTKNWWKSNGIILNILYLRNYGILQIVFKQGDKVESHCHLILRR